MMDQDLDALIRRVDPDRWLSSRFVADAAARADLVALYALDHELRRVAQAVRDPLMGEIRLTWWREALEDLAGGRPPRAHPVLRAIATGQLPPGDLATLAEARLGDLDDLSGEALVRHVDAAEGLVMTLAARRLAASADARDLGQAARAWGLARRDPQAALAAVRASRADLGRLPPAAFPAAAHAALAADYARGKTPGDLGKRVRILGAVLTGRIG
ncbi:MAG: squalene/phytoene synthase family protein [Pseudomonadota bacterium]